jgi:hypothetical protein
VFESLALKLRRLVVEFVDLMRVGSRSMIYIHLVGLVVSLLGVFIRK